MTFRGFIQEFRGSWGSGLAILRIKRVDGAPVDVPCEHAPTVWALEHWFGGIINSSDTADGIPETVQQIEIAYSVDELGILIAFSPYTKWLKRGRPSIPVIGISDDDLFGLLRKAIPSS